MLPLALLLSHAFAFLDITTNNAEHITETPFLTITDEHVLAEKSHFKNVDASNEKMKLRGEGGANAFIAFTHENMADDWSTVLTFRKLNLHETQRASIQLWYTDTPLQEGKFMGAEGKFTGFLAGLELSAKHACAIFTYNYGFDFTEKDNLVMQRDRLDQHIFDGVDEITLKIVHTDNNFLIEMYSGASIISDSFRIHQNLLPVRDGMARYFGLTTTYKDCPEDVAFELAEFKIMERKEAEGYDAHDAHIDLNTHVPAKSAKEVQHSIANLNHFLAYADIALGGREGKAYTDAQVHLKETIREQRSRLDGMIAHARMKKKAEEDESQRNATAQIAEFTMRLAEIHRQLMGYRNTLHGLTEEKPYHLRSAVSMVFIFAVIASSIVLLGKLGSKYGRCSPTEKKK